MEDYLSEVPREQKLDEDRLAVMVHKCHEAYTPLNESDEALRATRGHIGQIRCDEQKRHLVHPTQNIATSPKGWDVRLYRRV
jgi:hypothetical protein